MATEFWAIYTTASGEIVSSGQGPVGSGSAYPIDLGTQTLYTTTAESSGISSRTHYFLAGVPTAYTSLQAAAKAARPGTEGYHWSNAIMAWVDERDLSIMRRDKLVEMKLAYKAAAENFTFTWGSVPWACSSEFREALSSAAQVAHMKATAGQPFSQMFTEADGLTDHTLVRDSILDLHESMSHELAALAIRWRTKRDAVFAATTTSDVAAITFWG